MSSVGQAIGGLVGAAVGFFIPGIGPLYGAQIGMSLGGFLDPPKGPTINGPGLDDLTIQTSTYGAPIPRDYGTIATTGNIFWLKGDEIDEVTTTTTSGGKGGPVQTMKNRAYYATFAVGLCKGPIEGVNRIWIGGQLWYEAHGDTMEAIIASNKMSEKFTLYLGTDTQTADPLIQADKGAANVPAYRGLAYLVFDQLPLADYGNNLAGTQVKVEVVTDRADVASYDIVTRADSYLSGSSGVVFPATKRDVNYAIVSRFTSAAFGVPAITQHNFDVSIQTTITNTFDVAYQCLRAEGDCLYICNEYLVPYFRVGYSMDSSVYDRFRISAFGASAGSNIQALLYEGRLYVNWVGGTNAGYISLCNTPTIDGVDGTEVNRTDLFVLSITLGDGCLLAITSTTIYRLDLDTLATLSSVSYTSQYTMSTTGVYISWDSGKLWLLPRNDDGGSTASYGCLQSYDVTTGTRIDLVRDIPYGGGSASYGQPAVVVDGLIRRISKVDQEFLITVFGLHASNRVILGDIVESEALTSNLLESSDLDVTDLTDEVRGYRIAQIGAIRGGLEPLRAAWPFDVVQHGYTIKFKRRGSSSVITIPAADLDARQAGSEPGIQITDAREMDLVLPRKVQINYLDVVREYDTNSQYTERSNTDAVNEQVIDLAIVFSGTEAAAKTETLLYLYWMERYTINFTLPHSYSQLEPGDVATVEANQATYELRLTSVNFLSDGRIECQAKYNKAAIYSPVAVGEEGQSIGRPLQHAGPSLYLPLDIPLMRDDDDTAGFPIAMTGYYDGWPGGAVYRSVDDGQTWTGIADFDSAGSTIGFASNTISVHGGTVYDHSSVLNVRMVNGTLASVTESQLFSGQNWFAYGVDGRWEIIAARTVTDLGGGLYTLQDLLRGQKGTEWATGLHTINDSLVLLTYDSLRFNSVNLSTMGVEYDYRGITLGDSIDSDSNLLFSYNGVNLKCLSPCHVTGNRHPTTNDWTFTWVPRSRYGAWRDYVDAPLGEASEHYLIGYYSSSAYTTRKNYEIVVATKTATYTSAQQVADFGSNQTTMYVMIQQMSETAGFGYPLTATITR